MNSFIDSHAHIYDEYYDNVDLVLDNANKNGINIVINSGCDHKSNIEVLEKSNNYSNMYATLGIHPEFANDYRLDDLIYIKNNVNNPKVVAIGEIGLDYHYEGYNKEKQIELFKKQLDIAKEVNLPVVIHSRDATIDTINILKSYPTVTGVIHSFSGSKQTAKEYIKMGYLLGINGVLTFKNAKIKDVISEIGIENIILETDSPYLTPEPYRGKKNESSNILYIANYLENLLNIPLETISKITNNNINRLFKIKTR